MSAYVEIETEGTEELLASFEAFTDGTTKIEVEIEFVMVGGLTPAASVYYSTIRSVFGSGFAMSEGPVVRNIAGTSTPSQHSYGNAVDVMVSGTLHREIAYFSDANRGALSIAHLLADPYFPSPLGDHFTHVHADFNPQGPY